MKDPLIPDNKAIVSVQIRGSQIINAIRLHKVGFPKHMGLSEFRRRFALLSNDNNARPGSPVADERRGVEDMLLTIDIDPASYRVGQSQVSDILVYLLYQVSNVLPLNTYINPNVLFEHDPVSSSQGLLDLVDGIAYIYINFSFFEGKPRLTQKPPYEPSARSSHLSAKACIS